MRRAMLLVVSVLTILTMVASPAFAHDWDGDGWDEEGGFWVLVFVEFDDIEFDDIEFDDIEFDDIDCDWDDCDFDGHDWDWNRCEGPVCLID